jgi:hypothetical protein
VEHTTDARIHGVQEKDVFIDERTGQPFVDIFEP